MWILCQILRLLLNCVLNLIVNAAAQEEVYEEIAPLVRSCLDGHNACIFAYGQTGSGAPQCMIGCTYNALTPVKQSQAWRAGPDLPADHIIALLEHPSCEHG